VATTISSGKFEPTYWKFEMNRNDYRNWTAEQVATDAVDTWNRMTFCGIRVADIVDPATGLPLKLPRLTYEVAVKRLGMKLVTADITYDVDASGETILDDKGRPVELTRTLPVYDMAVSVKVEGYTDCYGTLIPKGKQYFIAELESANRQPTESNVIDLRNRLRQWILTGEALIKDSMGSGQNEQHRCWAMVFDRLTGTNYAPPEGIPVVTIDGVSVGGAGAIDSGKKKSAADDLSANHEVLRFPLTRADYVSGTANGYGADQKIARAKILKELQGVAKRIVLRMVGGNVKASKFTGHDSGGYANQLCSSWVGLDDVVNMVYAYIVSIPLKDEAKRPFRCVRVWELATAYALFSLRENDVLESVDGLGDYAFPTIDTDPLQEFLADLEEGTYNGKGPLADWVRIRLTPERQKDTDESSFAQVVLAMKAYFGGNLPVDPSFCQGGKDGATGSKNQTGTKFTSFGGADRGPIAKKVKEKA